MRKMNEKIGKIQFHKRIEQTCYGKCDCGNEYKCSDSYHYLGKKGKVDLMCRDCKNNSMHGNLVGKKFGNLTVLKQQHNKLSWSRGNRVWGVKCDCGNEEIILGTHLNSGMSKCSKCRNRVRAHTFIKQNSYVRGQKQKITSACNSKNSPYYKIFGKVGIKICGEWRLISFFEKWAKKNGLVKGKRIYLFYGETVFSPKNCFVADNVRFTPYLDPKLRPIAINSLESKLGIFSRLKSFIFDKVA